MQIRYECLALFKLRLRPNTFNVLECCPNAMDLFFLFSESLKPSDLLLRSPPVPWPWPSPKRVTFWPQSRPKKLLTTRAKERKNMRNKRRRKPMTVAILMSTMMLSFWLIPILILYRVCSIYGNRNGWGDVALSRLLSITYLRTSVAVANLLDCKPTNRTTGHICD